MPSRFESNERSVNPAQRFLDHLGLYVAQMSQNLLGRCQRVLLLVVVRIWRICRHDVLTRQGTRIDSALPRFDPILPLSQCIVEYAAQPLKPRRHAGLLLNRWINFVLVVHRKHAFILAI